MAWVEIAAVAGVILGIIGTALGVINLFWGINILGRRTKVIVTEPSLYFDLGLEGYALGGKKVANVNIRAGFNLVRTSGDKDLFIKEAHVKLNTHLHKRFNEYFPPYSPYLRFQISQPQKLEINKPCSFKHSIELAGSDVGSRLLESPDEKRDFDEITTCMEEEFEMHWKYSGEKTGYYRYPPKWWHKVVPVRFRKW